MGAHDLLPAGLLDTLRAAVGERHVILAEADQEPFVTDWRGQYRGRAAAVVKPGSTDEVARVVTALAQAGVGIVPQGGNTSLCGASVPDASGTQVVVNLSRMSRVRAVDLENDTLTVEAGCVLAQLQAIALEHGKFFPLSLAAEGSCEIGGNISTNAGGTQVLRYGNTRELVLGLEVVLPDGRVWNGLRGLRKDNTGYDLKQLFIGAEGTLGIVTAAVLKLYPKPAAACTALAAIPSPTHALKLLGHLRAACGERLTGFEIIGRACIDLVVQHIPGSTDPFAEPHRWYALVELFDSGAEEALRDKLTEALGEAAEKGLVVDAVIAASEAQREALWGLRENTPEAQRIEGYSVKHDVSVPVSRTAQLIEEGGRALESAFPGIRIVAFGHLGDGNIHWNVFPPAGVADVKAWSAQVNAAAYEQVSRLGGSISAEHGIGVLKRDTLTGHKDALELELMKAVKRALDPRGLMNPGKVLQP